MKNAASQEIQAIAIGYYKVNDGKTTRYYNGSYWCSLSTGSMFQRDWEFNRLAIQPSVKTLKQVGRPSNPNQIKN